MDGILDLSLLLLSSKIFDQYSSTYRQINTYLKLKFIPEVHHIKDYSHAS